MERNITERSSYVKLFLSCVYIELTFDANKRVSVYNMQDFSQQKPVAGQGARRPEKTRKPPPAGRFPLAGGLPDTPRAGA
ncbi:hypothetical protein, partial [Anaerotruncus massiliensis (ex Liu et al. 2021)]|uniref:hypothetical protein n=1 Tax=Anaerotruncus massiliensis (ex Liu et al. 2021) TaxID=2321404 RepID=UPI003A86C970